MSFFSLMKKSSTISTTIIKTNFAGSEMTSSKDDVIRIDLSHLQGYVHTVPVIKRITAEIDPIQCEQEQVLCYVILQNAVFLRL